MVRQDADGIRFKWPAGVDRTINLPQAFDMFDKELAGAISKHNREKRISRLQYLDADIATLPDYGMRGRPRAQNRATLPRLAGAISRTPTSARHR